jgi:hypothetical protein
MNPQSTPAQNQDREPAAQVPDIPAAPTPAAPDPQAGAPLPVAPTNIPAAPAVNPGQPVAAPATPNPATASDDVDVIEKEWVDKAETVMKQTEGDPHAEEEAVEDLQVDYLQKRFNHKVDKPQEG